MCWRLNIVLKAWKALACKTRQKLKCFLACPRRLVFISSRVPYSFYLGLVWVFYGRFISGKTFQREQPLFQKKCCWPIKFALGGCSNWAGATFFLKLYALTNQNAPHGLLKFLWAPLPRLLINLFREHGPSQNGCHHSADTQLGTAYLPSESLFFKAVL